ncbi:MAG: methionyl-tRNA formyltransferase [bacterium]|nr:methionyl-tRNA formyltransferase [bacterium]
MSKKLVFFGNQKLATGIYTKPLVMEALAKNNYELAAAITDKIPENLANLGAEAAVLVAYGHIIPENIITIFPKGIINIHPSLLPIYRGPTPIEQAILNGAKETGVSLMKLSAKMDAGPIFSQAKINLTGSETKQELADKLLSLGTELLIKQLPAILGGSEVSTPQDGSLATYTNLIKKGDGMVDWSKPAQQIEREVRAYQGWPKTQAKIFGHDVIIMSARVAGGQNDGDLVMQCQPGWLEIQELKAPSGRTMSGKDFLHGYTKHRTINNKQ